MAKSDERLQDLRDELSRVPDLRRPIPTALLKPVAASLGSCKLLFLDATTQERPPHYRSDYDYKLVAITEWFAVDAGAESDSHGNVGDNVSLDIIPLRRLLKISGVSMTKMHWVLSFDGGESLSFPIMRVGKRTFPPEVGKAAQQTIEFLLLYDRTVHWSS
jgi:hypothetical protein